MNEKEVKHIFDEMDFYDNHQINYSEFLAVNLDIKNLIKDDKLFRALYSQFDTDGCGEISRNDIVNAMCKIGHSITQSELDQIMNEHDLDHNDAISYDEFKAIFQKSVEQI